MPSLNTNLKGLTSNVQTRLETLNGIEYIVAPVVMIREGVLPGSMGPILYTSNEIQASTPYWNDVPVTVNHPTDSSGQYVSARSPEIIEQFGVGQIYNTRYDSETSSLKAEAWLQKEVLEEKFPDVYNEIISGNSQMEVSTGVFFDERGEPGTFGDTPYNSTAYNYHGDHLALLPNAEGACSWADGCGLRANSKKNKEKEIFLNKQKQYQKLLLNELSFGDVEQSLWKYVDSLDNNEYTYYVDNVFDTWLTIARYERTNERQKTLWKATYTKENDVVNVSDDHQRVKEERVYTPISEDAIQPSGVSTITNKSSEENEMAEKAPCCPKRVDELISAEKTSFSEGDREFLLSLNEKQLEQAELSDFATNTTTQEGDEPVADLTTEEYIAKAPEDVQVYLNGLVAKEKKERQDIIEKLSANEACLFSKEELEGFSTDQLAKLSGSVNKAVQEPAKDETQDLPADMSLNAGTVTKTEVPGAVKFTEEDALPGSVTINWKEGV